MTRPRLALACCTLALGLTLAACGGGSTTATGGGSDGSTATPAPAMTDAGSGADPTAGAAGSGTDAATTLPACADVLSDAEAAAVIGKTPKPVKDGSSPYGVYCAWEISDGFALTVDANVDPTSVGLWRGWKDSVPTANDGKETTPPSGLGDEAYAFDANAGTYWIFVRRGDRTLRVGFPSVPSEQTVRDLVDTLFSRL